MSVSDSKAPLAFARPHGVAEADERRVNTHSADASLVTDLRRQVETRDAIIDDLEKDAREQTRASLAWKEVVQFTNEATTIGEILRVVAALSAAGHDVRITGLCGDYADHPIVGLAIAVTCNEIGVVA
jgi:hypothetical protein